MIEDPGAEDSLALGASFFFGVVEAGVSVEGVDVVGVVAAPADDPPTEITCAGGTLVEPAPARPIRTPTPIAKSKTPMPASRASVLLRPVGCAGGSGGAPGDLPATTHRNLRSDAPGRVRKRGQIRSSTGDRTAHVSARCAAMQAVALVGRKRSATLGARLSDDRDRLGDGAPQLAVCGGLGHHESIVHLRRAPSCDDLVNTAKSPVFGRVGAGDLVESAAEILGLGDRL